MADFRDLVDKWRWERAQRLQERLKLHATDRKIDAKVSKILGIRPLNKNYEKKMIEVKEERAKSAPFPLPRDTRTTILRKLMRDPNYNKEFNLKLQRFSILGRRGNESTCNISICPPCPRNKKESGSILAETATMIKGLEKWLKRHNKDVKITNLKKLRRSYSNPTIQDEFQMELPLEKVLKDLLNALENGWRSELARDWLNSIKNSYDYAVNLPLYWECFRLVNNDEEKENVNQDELDVTINELTKTFDSFHINTPNRVAVKNLPNSLNPSRVLFEISQSRNQENVLITPVRRSIRNIKTPKSCLIKSMRELSPTDEEKIIFRPNKLLLL